MPAFPLAEPLVPAIDCSLSQVHLHLLEHLAPPSVLVDQEFTALHLSEGVGRFCLHSGGTLSQRITSLVRPELRAHLQNALVRAFDAGTGGFTAPVALHLGGELREVTLGVWPRTDPKDERRLALVVFMDDACVVRPHLVAAPVVHGDPSESLRDELRRTRAELRALQDEHAAANAEFQTTTQELQTINEEYSMTAEELRHRKAELQSANEVLEAVNGELKLKLDEVSRARSDIENLMAATDIGTLFLDAELRIVRFTPRLADFFRVLETDVGRRIDDLSHDLVYGGLARDAQRVLQSRMPLERESRTTSNGWVLIRMRPYRTLDDTIDGVVVTLVDVTEQKGTEEALKRNRERLSNELRTSQQVQRMTDRMARSSTVREALEEVLETATDLVGIRSIAIYLVDDGARVLHLHAHRGLGTPYLEALTRIDLSSSHGVVSRAWRERRRIDVDDLMREPRDPTLASVARSSGFQSVQATPLIAAGDVVLGVLTTHLGESRHLHVHEARLLDLLASHAANLVARLKHEQMLEQRTEELRAREAELRVQAEVLRENDRRKTEFVCMLSHELRNPLAVVRNTLSHLRENAGGRWAASSDDAVAMLDRQSAHMARLVSDLLDVSRINKGKIELSREPVALPQCLHDVLAALDHKLKERDIDLRLELEGEAELVVDADRDRLLQILENLLSNAVKFSQRGGSIRVVARRQGNTVETRIVDCGIGIPREALEDIFLPFTQVGNFDRSGLGVGLSLVTNLIGLHGGDIRVESDGPGTGSTFTFCLNAAQAPAKVHAASGVHSTQSRRILVVDDNEDAADSFAMLLQARGHDVECAYDGHEAEIAAKERRPDVAFLDLGMPRMDGYELASRLRRIFTSAQVTLVAVSGHVPDHRFHASGLDHHMLKPVDMREIDRLLGRLPARVDLRQEVYSPASQ